MRFSLILIAAASIIAAAASAAPGAAPVSRTITEVLRDPLPPEDLRCTTDDARIVVQGSTFRYAVDRSTGAIAELEAMRDGRVVARLTEPAALWLDDANLAEATGADAAQVTAESPGQVRVTAEGRWGSVPYTLEHTFYDDGVLVTEVVLQPEQDTVVRRGLRHEVSAAGRFGQYMHKRRDTEGMDSLKGALPAAGTTVPLTTLTSCLQVFSAEAALAVFTDRGGTHRSPGGIETASLRVDAVGDGDASVTMAQYLMHVGAEGAAHTLRAGEPFRFRVGLAVAPNRPAHPRWRDLRMFIWVGDQHHPYPTDEEIMAAAHLGFTVFQMHRLGTPGIPRPPAEELDRVLKTVHDAGMLFVWTANADLMYASAPGVQELMAADKWSLWQGFNYGGRYIARMDPYCDLPATCLASPNSLADYRVRTKNDMLDRYPVDGMYIDDNLAYANCTLWREHGHPEPVYDCLIELHDMNWRRRHTFKAKRPHAVLFDHCSYGFVLPVVSAFDAHLFGEGYSFPSIDAYWNIFGSFKNMNAQGSLFAGDSEEVRCSAEIAYTFDLLTGGGQYCYLDWRLWPEKFPYAAGVKPEEPLFIATYNLAQYYFGMYESEPHYFALARDQFTTTAPDTHATIYENTVWNEALIVLANMGGTAATTSLAFHDPKIRALTDERTVAVYDVNRRTVAVVPSDALFGQFADRALDPFQMKLFHVRGVPERGVYHQWGGKRISETWDPATGTLTVRLHGPVGLTDTVFLGAAGRGLERVTVNGAPAEFHADPGNGLAHGAVTFGREPITLVATCAQDGVNRLPERAVTPDRLTIEVFGNRDNGS